MALGLHFGGVMLRRLRIPLILLVLVGLGACGPSRSKGGHNTTHFGDRGVEQEPPLLNGEREYSDLKPYQVPEVVLERESAPVIQHHQDDTDIKISHAQMKIDSVSQSVTLKFDVSSARGEETINLKGFFDRGAAPWKATLYATDQKILEERRVQATFLCTTAYYCDVVGIDIYYQVIDGKKPTVVQITEGVQGPRIAMNEDGPEETDVLSQEPPAETEVPPKGETPAGDTGTVAPTPDQTQSTKPADTKPAADGKPEETRPAEKPADQSTPQITPPEVAPPAKPAEKPKVPDLASLTPEQRKNVAIVYSPRMDIQKPEENKFRIKGLDPIVVNAPPATTPPTTGTTSSVNQAYKTQDTGWLSNPDYMPLMGNGFIRKSIYSNPDVTKETDKTQAWGTRRMLEYITDVGNAFSQTGPDAQMVLTGVSGPKGGQVIAGQASHKNGLDSDWRYKCKKDPIAPCKAVYDGRISSDFDAAATWKMLMSHCSAKLDWIQVIFVDQAVKQKFCEEAKRDGADLTDRNSVAFQCLQHMVHWDRHTDHAHVRLKCNESTCKDSEISLPLNSGCRI